MTAGPAILRRLAAATTIALLMHWCSEDDTARRRQAAGPDPSIANLTRIADASRGQRLFGQCAACHTIARGAPDQAGPNLFNVVNSPVAGVSPTFGYTYALKQKGGRWTIPRLHRWLANPRRFVPGTQMLFPGLADPIDRADVIAFLTTQTPQAAAK